MCAYAKDGYPTELANKVGHIKLIKDPFIQRMVESFEDSKPAEDAVLPPPTGHVDMAGACSIDQIITVDGGHQAVPNLVRPERQVGFVQVASQLVKCADLDHLRDHPMADPRDVQNLLGKFTHHTLAVLPLSGVRIPGHTVRQSLREALHRFLSHYDLYPALSYLVYREWEPNPENLPSMNCLVCGVPFEWPRRSMQHSCASCGEHHRLSDYLGLFDQEAEDRSRAELVSNFRSALEALVLFSFVIRFRNVDQIMNRTLFLLDGPLLLRAQLSRLVEPIRGLIADQRKQGKTIYLCGVEKGGDLRAYADGYAPKLKEVGDYLAPGTKYLVEEIQARAFDAVSYRNRVNYGAKVIARVGRDHVLVLNVPTGEFVLEPTATHLIGLDDIVRLLSRVLSYSHENALIPIVLANSEASISNQPSGSLLGQFVDRILHGIAS